MCYNVFMQTVETITQTDPEAQSRVDLIAAAQLLDEAYREGNPELIRKAHQLVEEARKLGSLATQDEAPQVTITRLEPSNRGTQKPGTFGKLRRVTVTAGTIPNTKGVPRGQRSPYSRS
jgi:DNA-binding phage protein